MQFTPEQDRALKAIDHWLKHGDSQVFRLFGTAGTGKTMLAGHVRQMVDGDVLCITPTGKAASVLRKRGWHDATTIHSVAYVLANQSKRYLVSLQEELHAHEVALLEAPDDDLILERIAELKDAIQRESTSLGKPMFRKNELSPLRNAALAVVDESSMVDDTVGNDLLSFGCKFLVLGDPAQLPPVRGEGFFTRGHPDFLLKEIHRQAKESPIISLAESIRNGQRPPIGVYGDGVEVLSKSSLDPELISERVAQGAQLLVGKNDTRNATNARVRTLHGRAGWLPEPGERLVCLRNNHEFGLLNGDQWNVEQALDYDDGETVALELSQGENVLSVTAHSHYFQGRGKDLQWWEKRDAEEFDYGYALTTHKAQGSQWEEVFVFDQSACFGADWKRWLYTAVTRAESKLKIVYM